MRTYFRYLAITLTATGIAVVFYLGLHTLLKHIYDGIRIILSLAVWVICMNGLDKPFHDLPPKPNENR
jgi:hypothetical protein